MGISGVSQGFGAFTAYWQSTLRQGRQDLRQIATALRDGDIVAAQQAFADLKQIMPGAGTPVAGPAAGAAPAPPSGDATTPAVGSTAVPPADPRQLVRADLDALGLALESGDLTASQAAFAKLQQDMQAMRGHHHHHDHDHDEDGEHESEAGRVAAAPTTSISTPAAPATQNVVSITGRAAGGFEGTHAIDLTA